MQKHNKWHLLRNIYTTLYERAVTGSLHVNIRAPHNLQRAHSSPRLAQSQHVIRPHVHLSPLRSLRPLCTLSPLCTLRFVTLRAGSLMN